jgi:hypothetical protein
MYSERAAGIAQSAVQWLGMGWTTEGSEFESQYGKEFSRRPDRLWSPLSLLHNGYQALLLRR